MTVRKKEPRPKDAYFARAHNARAAVTFENVQLETDYSDFLPRDAMLETIFSRNVGLKIPIVSAAMDTVTEREMAIALAQCGGLGVIHRGLTPEEQAKQVGWVKRFESGFVKTPECVFDNEMVADVLRRTADRTYHSFPVLSHENESLVGMLTRNDIAFCEDTSVSVSSIMTPHRVLVTAPENTSPGEAHAKMCVSKKKQLPLITSGWQLAGLYLWSPLREGRLKNSLRNVDVDGRLRAGAAVGTGDNALARLEKLVSCGVDVVVIDASHGDTKSVTETLQEIKRQYANIDVVVGNVSQGESARRLVRAGADGIKVGQGSGAACTTALVAGIGKPQLMAVHECELAIRGSGVPICADGGVRFPGDIGKAIGAGAHSVMMGGVLARTDEAPGEIVYYEGRMYKDYRGMGSTGAMRQYKGSRDRYRQSDSGDPIPEGVEGLVPYAGPLRDVLHQFVGGLRSTMGYVGARDIVTLQRKARFGPAAIHEARPHDVIITKEPPNYTMS